MVLPRRLKKKVRKTLVFFVKFANRLITMLGTKASPNVTFFKKFGHVEKDFWHKKREQANFFEKHEEEREENLFFASKSDASTKAMNGMLIVVLVIT